MHHGDCSRSWNAGPCLGIGTMYGRMSMEIRQREQGNPNWKFGGDRDDGPKCRCVVQTIGGIAWGFHLGVVRKDRAVEMGGNETLLRPICYV